MDPSCYLGLVSTGTVVWAAMTAGLKVRQFDRRQEEGSADGAGAGQP
jgi:hypothetical protein